MESFADIIMKDQTEYNNGNALWVQFVKDHIHILLKNSTIETYAAAEKQKFRYRPEDYAKKFDIEYEDTWILVLLNRWDPNEGIPQYAEQIIVPSPQFIETLKQQFDLYQSVIPTNLVT